MMNYIIAGEHMRRILTATVVFLTITALLGGCGGSAGSESAQIRRARMVGNENLKLKKQLDDKDNEINRLEQNIVDLEAEKVKIQKNCGDTNQKIMQLWADSEKRNQELTVENQTLKEELEKLKK